MKNYFNAVFKDGKIEIQSNTNWSVRLNGNFMLSKYSGEGNDSIDLIIPDDISIAKGNAYFSYGKTHCADLKNMRIVEANKQYFKIVPDSIILSEKNDFAIIDVLTNGNFRIKSLDNDYFKFIEYGDNKLMVVLDTDEKFDEQIITILDTSNPNSGILKIYQ